MPTIDVDDLDLSDSGSTNAVRPSPNKRKRKASSSVIDLTEDSPSPTLVASTSNARPSPSIPRRQSSNEDIVFTGRSQVSPMVRSQSSRPNDNVLQVPRRPASRFVDLTHGNRSAIVTQDMLPQNARNFLHRQSQPSFPEHLFTLAREAAQSIVGHLPLNRPPRPASSPPVDPPPPPPPAHAQPRRVGGGIARGRGARHGGAPFHHARAYTPWEQQEYDDDADDFHAFLRSNIPRFVGLGGGFLAQFPPFGLGGGGPAAPMPNDKPAKYDFKKSHPHNLDPGFSRSIVPPDEIISLDADPGAADDDYEEVPVCAGCERELFLGNEAEKDSARPYALRCGHLVCAECAAKGKKAKQSRGGKKGKGKKAKVEEGFAPMWTGCPVKSCDGASTAWTRKVGHEDGIWDVFL